MVAIRFPVRVGSERRQVSCYWARPPAKTEINRLKAWDGGATARGQDAAEFARFAAMKWEMTCELGSVASSLAEMDTVIRANPKIEVSAMLLAEAGWFGPGLLGVCVFHRTWAGNVFLDFLAAHPRGERGDAGISGLGLGLLYQLCEVTRHLQADLLWGETTALSAPIYRRYFQLPGETDRLLVTPAQQDLFRRSVRDRWDNLWQS